MNMVEELRRHRRRTGIGPRRLLSEDSAVPEGLHWPMVEKWLLGTTRNADPEHLIYVLERWRQLPDCGRPEPDYVPISVPALATMRYHQKRTGLDPCALLQGAADKPEGLHADLIQAWLRSATKSTLREYLQYVLGPVEI